MVFMVPSHITSLKIHLVLPLSGHMDPFLPFLFFFLLFSSFFFCIALKVVSNVHLLLHILGEIIAH